MGTVRSGVMKPLALSSHLLAFAGIPACDDAKAPLGPPTPPPPPLAPAPASIYAITNVTAITMGDGDPVLEEQTVVIRGAVTEVMGPSAQTSVPDSAIVIDGTMAVIGHVPDLMSPQDAVSSAQKMIAHASEYWWQHYDTLPNESRTPEAIAFAVNGGTWLTNIMSITKDFHDGGVRLLLGTDSPDVVGLA